MIAMVILVFNSNAAMTAIVSARKLLDLQVSFVSGKFLSVRFDVAIGSLLEAPDHGWSLVFW
jgi:hypothetical protein